MDHALGVAKDDLRVLAEIEATLRRLATEVKRIIGDEFLGLYVHGSLAMGDFNQRSSDVDFLVVTEEAISNEQFAAAKDMHARLAVDEEPWGKRLEGSYVPIRLLGSKTPPVHPRPFVNYGELRMAAYGGEWTTERHTLREYGIIIEGRSPKELIPPVQPSEIRQAVVHILDHWWAPRLKDPAPISASDYQAYSVLTMCRVLYTLTSGHLCSKKRAAEWAEEYLGSQWTPLIREALGWEIGEEFDNLPDVLNLIRLTVECARADAPKMRP